MPDENEYPILLVSFMRVKNSLQNLIAEPHRVKTKEGLNGYVFLINNIQFVFYVNSINHILPNYIKKATLKINGQMTVLHLLDGSEMDFIKGIIKKK